MTLASSANAGLIRHQSFDPKGVTTLSQFREDYCNAFFRGRTDGAITHVHRVIVDFLFFRKWATMFAVDTGGGDEGFLTPFLACRNEANLLIRSAIIDCRCHNRSNDGRNDRDKTSLRSKFESYDSSQVRLSFYASDFSSFQLRSRYR